MKFEEVYLKELVKIKNGKDHKLLKEGNYPVYGSGGVMRYVNKYLYDKESVLLPRKGTLNNIQFATRPFWTVDTCYYTEINTTKVIPYFLYSSLRQFNVNALNTGATIPSMTFDKYYSIKINLPSLDNQEKIVNVLKTYDDLIENNQKQIALLEEAAQRLYKEWFIDLRFPGYESVKVVDGVPEGWKRGIVENVATFKRGKTITKDEVISGEVPVVAGGLSPAYYHNKANTKAPVITVSASGANAGFTKLYNIDVFASDCSYVDSNGTPYLYFLYFFLKSDKKKTKCLQKGSAQPHVYASDLNAMELLIPDESLLIEYNKLVENIYSKIQLLEIQNIKLKRLRDALLPKLMSGEIEV